MRGCSPSCVVAPERSQARRVGSVVVQLLTHSLPRPAELFATLASLLSSFPALLAASHFLLIPGPTDPYSSAALPRPALPDSLAKPLLARIPNLTLGSNPCRVRWLSQELVFFRDDVMGRMMRNAVRFPAEEPGRKGDLRKAVRAPLPRLGGLLPRARSSGPPS